MNLNTFIKFSTLCTAALMIACSPVSSRMNTSPSSPTIRTISVDSKKGWVRTNFSFSAGQVLHFSATGKWSNGLYRNSSGDIFRPVYSPDGEPSLENSRFTYLFSNSDTKVGKLIGRIGSYTFNIGSDATVNIPQSGILEMAMNDATDSFKDNEGSVNVIIEVK